MTILSSGSTYSLTIPAGNALVTLDLSGTSTVTGVTREDASRWHGTGAKSSNRVSTATAITISTTGQVDYRFVAGDATPSSDEIHYNPVTYDMSSSDAAAVAAATFTNSPRRSFYVAYKKWAAAMANMRAGVADANVLDLGDSTASGFGAGGTTYGANAHQYSLGPQLTKLLNANYTTARASGIFGMNLQTCAQMASFDPQWNFDTGSWGTVGLGPSMPGSYLLVCMSGTGFIQYTPDSAADTWEIWYRRASGLASFDVSVDAGATIQTVVTAGAESIQKVTVTGAGSTLKIKRNSGTPSGWIQIFGVRASLSTARAINVVQSGVSGCKAGLYTSSQSQASDFVNIIGQLGVQLTAIGLTINDAIQGTPIATYKATLQTLVSACQAAGSDVILRVGRPVGVNNVSLAQQQAYRDAVYAVAQANSLWVDDVFGRMVSYEDQQAASTGLYYDTIHPNTPGYLHEAAGLGADFFRQF